MATQSTASSSRSWSAQTSLIHSGEKRIQGSTLTPIFQSATYLHTPQPQGSYFDIKYIRLSNSPNHEVLCEKLAALDGAEAAAVMTSGMAAISTTMLALLKAGDHLLVQKVLYGGTQALVHEDLPPLGIQVTTIDPSNPSEWESALRPTTKVLYVETISNPLCGIPHLDAIVAFGKAHGLVTVVDNTFASPLVFRPLPFGFDLAVQSATKYLNGHSDLCAGVVTGS